MKAAKRGLAGLLLACCIAFAQDAACQSPSGFSTSATERVEQGLSGQSTESLRIGLRKAALDQSTLVSDHSAERQRLTRVTVSSATVGAASLISPRLLLRTDNIAYRTMERVGFTWHIEPFVAGVLYYINFGDGYGGWVTGTEAEHGYRQSGAYRVLLRARVGRRDIESNEILVTVQEVVRPWLYRWLAAILGMAGAVLVLSYAFVSTRKREGGTRKRENTSASPLVVLAHKDAGTHRLEFSTRTSVVPEVRFQPVVDMGIQLIGQRISASERKDAKHA
jgi:hypothetical protein